MENPRPEKVAIVAEVKERIASSDATILAEYRGMSVKQLHELRKQLRQVGGELKVYKNTLVRLAAREAGVEGADDLLTGPTAIAFVKGDIAAAAKTLRDAAKVIAPLTLKGGILDSKILSLADVEALADLPSRDVLLSQIAGVFEAPISQFASLLEAVPRSFAYGVQALIDKQDAA
jgi:large subunit ribosomal protein L10